jgi:hypothetical protein
LALSGLRLPVFLQALSERHDLEPLSVWSVYKYGIGSCHFTRRLKRKRHFKLTNILSTYARAHTHNPFTQYIIYNKFHTLHSFEQKEVNKKQTKQELASSNVRFNFLHKKKATHTNSLYSISATLHFVRCLVKYWLEIQLFVELRSHSGSR